MSIGLGKIEAELNPAIRLPVHIQGDHGLHGKALLAEIENHAAGDAVETGKDRAVHFMAQATPSLWEHRSSQLGLVRAHEHSVIELLG
jgi:hypothetical protein